MTPSSMTSRTATKSPVTIKPLTVGKGYTFQVRGVNRGVMSAWTNTTPETLTIMTVPTAPRGLVKTETVSGSDLTVTLEWIAPEKTGGSEITGYDYRVNDNAWEPVGDATVRTKVVTGLSATVDYTFYVRAKNAIGAGPAADTGGGTTGPGTGTPGVGTTGDITSITIDGAVDKSIGGVKRMHVKEGDLTTVTATIRWTFEQLREMWKDVPAGGKPADVPVEIVMMPSAGNGTWLSPAEEEDGHDDVTIGASAMVVVPKIPATRSATARGYDHGTGQVSIAFNRDPDAEAEAFTLSVLAGDYNLVAGADAAVYVIEDTDEQGISLKRVGTAVIYEGGPNIAFDVQAVPARVNLDLQVRFDLEDVTGETVASRDNTLDKAIGTISTGPTAKDTVTLTLDDNDANRTDDKIKLHAEVVDYARDTGAYTGVGEQEVEIDVIDVHKLPPTMVSPMVKDAKEGTKTTLTYTVNRNPQVTIAIAGEVRQYTPEPLTLTVMAKDAAMKDDYRIMTPMVTIPKHDGKAPWTQMVEVEVELNADDDLGMETLMLDATVEGTVTANGPGMRMDPEAMATINIEDATVKLVEAKTQAELDAAIKEAGADAELTVDDMVTIMGSALFDSVEGATVIYSAMSSAAMVATASVGGGEIMVTAKGKGDAMITIEASASMGSGVKANPQTEPDRASVEIPIAVALAPLSVMLEGPDAGMNLVEGMEYTITAKANRAVEMDTMIELFQTAGSASPEDYTVENITISAGESMGTTKLMLLEDNMHENEGNMQESLTIEGRVGTMKTTNSLMFYLWDAAVPALPIIAQLLLATLLGIGGYRRYRRR